MEEQKREMSAIIGMIPGSCTCGTVTPAPAFHGETCSYRELAMRLKELENQVISSEPCDS